MAGDWIKFRKDLPADPVVTTLEPLLSLDTFAVIGRLMVLWAWADTHADRNGYVTRASRNGVDKLVQHIGFATALEQVGWLVVGADGLTFPKFERHMGEGAKARSGNAERQQRWRDRQRMKSLGMAPSEAGTEWLESSSGVVVPVTLRRNVTPLPEKRREEKSNTSCPESAEPTSGPDQSTPSVRNPDPTPEKTPEPVMTFPATGPGSSDGWPLLPAKLAEYQATYPTLDVLGELRKAWQWLQDNRARRKTMAGMTRFLGYWLGKAQDSGRSVAQPAAPTGAPRIKTPADNLNLVCSNSGTKA